MSAIVTSAVQLVTDETLAHVTPWALLTIALLLVFAVCWRDRGEPWIADQDVALNEVAPSVSPEVVAIEGVRRTSERG